MAVIHKSRNTLCFHLEQSVEMSNPAQLDIHGDIGAAEEILREIRTNASNSDVT